MILDEKNPIYKKIKKLNKKPERNKFAILLLHIRAQKKMNQVSLAGILGVTQGTISKLEAGSMNPEVRMWLKFQRLYQLEAL